MQWVSDILAWYGLHQRVLPWRELPTPYRVWVSEVMLQQTQVATVCPYFERFVARFPGVNELAEAPLQDVLKRWEGLGYYRRARYLHEAAQVLVKRHAGQLPRSPEGLLALPGIGTYTAAAIASIAFGCAVPVVDGNVQRVFARFWGIEESTRTAPIQRRLREGLTAAVRGSMDPSSFNQAIMELGALICTPRSPVCGSCPLSPGCKALAGNMVEMLPRREKARTVPHQRIAVGLLVHEGRLLIARRAEHKMLGGLWEFPGGKQEVEETLAETVVREMAEEVNLTVRVTEELCTITHAYSHFRITLTAFRCVLIGLPLSLRPDRETAWVRWDDLGLYPFPKANHKVFAALENRGFSLEP